MTEIAQSLASSRAHDAAVWLLSNIPGFPPIVQTVHLLGIAVVMGSIVMVNLKVLGLALPSQRTDEMVGRLTPWLWWALPLLFSSGLVFVLARPQRYFANPVFGYKLAMLAPAIVLAAFMQRLIAHQPELSALPPARRASVKAIAAVSLLLWIGVVLAGRWIAYADYLFPEL